MAEAGCVLQKAPAPLLLSLPARVSRPTAHAHPPSRHLARAFARPPRRSYAFSLTTFSPSGKLLQIEHALKAVTAGKTSLGIQGAWPPRPRPPLLPCGAPRARGHARHSSPAAKPHFPSRTATPPHPRPAAKDGVVIATEKKAPSSLVDESSWEKIALYTDSTGLVYSGMGPDFRVLVRQGQKKAAAYALQYGVRGALLGGRGGGAACCRLRARAAGAP